MKIMSVMGRRLGHQIVPGDEVTGEPAKMMKGFIRDMTKYLPGQIVPVIVGFVTIPIVTRLFAPPEWGDYALVMATVGVLSGIVAWVPISVIRFYPVYERDRRLGEFYRNITKLATISILVMSLVASAALIVLRVHISARLYSLMWIGILVFILTSGLEVLVNFIRAKRQVGWYSGFRIWRSIAAITFGILLVRVFRIGVNGFLLGSVLGLAVVFPLLWKKAVEGVSVSSKSLSFAFMSEMGKYSLPYVAVNLSAWVLSLSDRYILQFLRGAHEVGIYSISYQVGQSSIMLISYLFTLAFHPLSIMIWEKQGERASQEFVTKGTRYFLLLCIPAVIGISMVGKPVLNVLSTADYREGAKIIPLVALGNFLRGLNGRFEAGLVFSKKTHFLMYGLAISSLLNVGLNFLFVPRYGYLAAAATTLASYAFLLLLTIVFSRHFFVWEFPFGSLARAACASGAMGLAVYHVGNTLVSSTSLSLILSVVVGVVVYFLTLFLLREFEPSEVQALLDLKRRITTSHKVYES